MDTDAVLRRLLEGVKTVAVLGAKLGEREKAWRVPRYLVAAGFEVRAVNPKLTGWEGLAAWPDLGALPEPVDLIDVFRAPRHLAAHTDEILALPWRPRGVWFQLGIRDDASADRLAAAGIAVVQDRCLMVDHRRIFAS